MKRLLSLLAVTLSCFSALPVSAQTSYQLPREAVAFGYRGGTRIAVLEANGHWRFDDLPTAYFGAGDVAMISTVWSPDGRIAYVTMAAPEDGQYRYIYSYDIVTRQLTPVVFLDKGRAGYDFAEIQVSPDGRYLWINRFGDNSARLIDTQAPADKRVLAKLDQCPAADGWAVWLPGKVRVQGSLACSGTNYLFDLSTGQIVFKYLQTADEVDLTDAVVVLPTHTQPFVLVYSADQNTLSKLSLATGQPEKWLEDVTGLLVSSDKTWATFVHAGQLFTLDLATLATADLGTIGPVEDWFKTDDSLNYWTVEPPGSPQTIDRVTIQGGHRIDSTVYNAQPFDNVLLAPDGHGFLLDFGDADGFALYDAAGRQTWRSQDQTFPTQMQVRFGLFVALQGWTGDWYHWAVNTGSGPQTVKYSLAVNATTGKTLLAPGQGLYWVSGAPDGRWWLYSSLSCDAPTTDILVAYSVETGTLVTLAQDGVTHSCGAGYDEPAFYAWAPLPQ